VYWYRSHQKSRIVFVDDELRSLKPPKLCRTVGPKGLPGQSLVYGSSLLLLGAHRARYHGCLRIHLGLCMVYHTYRIDVGP